MEEKKIGKGGSKERMRGKENFEEHRRKKHNIFRRDTKHKRAKYSERLSMLKRLYLKVNYCCHTFPFT